MEKSYDEKSLKVNVKKTKAFCTGKKTVAMETSKFPCSVCRREVGSTSIQCINATVGCVKKCSRTVPHKLWYAYRCRYTSS